MVLTHLVQFKFYHGATVNEAVVPATFAGHTTFPPFYAFKGFSVGDAVPEPEPEPSTGLVGGGRLRRKVERYAIQIDGQWLFFNSWEAVDEYLESLKAKELEKAEEKVEKVVQRILRTGKTPKQAPKIRIQRAPKEVREQIDLLNAELERIYWRKVSEELAARADEDDIEILLEVI